MRRTIFLKIDFVRTALAVITLALVAGLPSAASAAPQTYALFVGIADYKHGEPGGEFEDLAGAPVDIIAVKGALESRIELSQSVTLLDAQATRGAIIAAFNELAAQAAPGDTLLFYYSGHGGQVFDMSGQQLSGFSSTIVPYDARDPALPQSEAGDILDNELRLMIDAASGLGVNVLTIFDSCNSGTATRFPELGEQGVRKRNAPALMVETAIEPKVELVSARSTNVGQPARAGFRVHIAAAPDGEAALERYVDGQWRGDFTEAFVEALDELSATATYRDLLGAVQINLRKWLRGSGQARVMLDVRGEGALDQSFLGGWNPARLLEGTRNEDGEWQLAAGKIAGITSGSRFAGYTSGGDALNESVKPVATAFVETVHAGYSKLKLDRGVEADGLPNRLTWRETARGAGENPLKVAIYPADAALPNSTKGMLDSLTFVEQVKANPDLVLDLSKAGSVRLARLEDNSTITSVGSSETSRLSEVLKQISSYRQMLNLIGTGSKLNVDFEISPTDCFGGNAVPQIQYDNGEPQFVSGNPDRSKFYFLVRNNEGRALYPHLVNLTAQYGIALASTQGTNAEEDFLPPGVCWNWPAEISGDGRDYMILVMADRPLPGLQNLAQEDLVARSVTDPLSNLIERAAVGTRSATGPAPAGIWSVQAKTYMIEGAEQ